MQRLWYGVASAALVLGMAGAAQAGSFALKESSASGQGASFAGVTASSDITHSAWNPAAMTYAGGQETCFDKGSLTNTLCGGSGLTVGGSIHYIMPDSDGTSASGLTGIDGTLDAAVPATYIGYRVDPQLVLGLSINSPFGLSTEYAPGEFGNVGLALGASAPRRSELVSVQVAPIVSYDVSDRLTIAGGPTVLMGKLIFETQIGGGGGAVANQEFDVDADPAFGFQIGALLRPTPYSRIGVSYHSGYNLFADGDSEVQGANGALLGFGFQNNTVGDAKVSADLPALVTFGAAVDVTERTTIMGEFQWQDWSALDSLQTSASNVFGGTVRFENFNYDDAIYAALGVEHSVSPALTLRTGIGYDETPTVLANRSTRIPDGNRMWLSAGATYHLSESAKIDLAYSYLTILEDESVATQSTGIAGNVAFEADAHIIGLGGSISLD